MKTIQQLCASRTTLSDEDIQTIEQLSRQLQMIADVSQSDVFIDCPVSDQSAALVVAQSQPVTAKSLYQTSVVGQLAYAKNEPAVLYSLHSGKPVIGSRGVSQEQMVMKQNVIPIRNRQGNTIGTLIMEQDISEQVEQEKNVEMLMETNGQLSETLLQMAIDEEKLPSLMHEGIVLFDSHRKVTYLNAPAENMLNYTGHLSSVKGQLIDELGFGKWAHVIFNQPSGTISEEIRFGTRTIQIKAVTFQRQQQTVGGLLLLRDVTDMKEKEKQLMIKSAVIQEIHHRVKNNLQMIAGLLRLQMRRTPSEELTAVYRDSINRIHSIAFVHEMLAYNGLDRIDVKEVIERISSSIVSSLTKPEQLILIEVTGEPLTLPPEKATSLALIVNELVHNSLIHAFHERTEGTIAVHLYHNHKIAGLTISDNGTGISDIEHVRHRNHKRLGLHIVETLVTEDLGGIVEWSSTPQGTEAVITYPLEKEEDG